MQKPLAAGSHAKSQRSSGAAEVGGISITHPDKVFWPAGSGRRAITKRDLAVYLAAVAPRILPHIVGRPLSMVRAPDGIDGERFFQRHPMKRRGADAVDARWRNNVHGNF
jgi:bifunctional non-homologous end joining protein LigD